MGRRFTMFSSLGDPTYTKLICDCLDRRFHLLQDFGVIAHLIEDGQGQQLRPARELIHGACPEQDDFKLLLEGA